MTCQTLSIYYSYVVYNFILLLSGYTLVKAKINKFLKDRMSRLFKNS